MRSEIPEICSELAGVVMDEGLSVAEWEALPPATRVAHRLADVIILLGMIREELQTEKASPLLWMEEPVDRVFTDTDRILRRLAV